MKKMTLHRIVMLFLIALLFGAECAIAENHDCIIIHMKAGNKVFVSMREHPKISFENQVLSIGTNQYQIFNVSKYTFGNFAQNIDNDKIASTGLLSSKDGHVYVQMSNPKSVIKVCSIDGMVLDVNVSIHADSIADIDLSNYPIGVYLLSIDGETLKIQKR